MNYYALFYLFSVADALNDIMGTLAVFSFVLTVFSIICTGVCIFNPHDFENETMRRWSRFVMFFSICSIVLGTLWMGVPSKKDMLLIIIGGGIAEFVTTDNNAKQIPTDLARWARIRILEEAKSVDIQKELGISPVDTLKEKSKEELIKIIQNNGK